MARLICLALFLWVGIAWGQTSVEANRELGFGFHEVRRSERSPPGVWEGMRHSSSLFYMDQELGEFDTYSIAPSGRYALYQDRPTGFLVLFTCTNRQRSTVATFSGTLAKRYEWREAQREAMVFFENGSSLRVSLAAP